MQTNSGAMNPLLCFTLPFGASRAAPRMAAVSPHRTALVTGASGGIGAATAAGLLRILPTLETLILCNRDPKKSASAASELRLLAPGVRVEEVPLDLGSLASVRACARGVMGKLEAGRRLDVAVFNAGVMACPLNFTADGLEYQYGVNHVGHALLALSLDRVLARSVYISSSAVAFASARRAPPTVAEKRRGGGFDPREYARWAAYGDSKLAMSMFARGAALAGADAVSLHPGIVNTELQRHILPKPLFEWGLRDAPAQNAFRALASAAGFKTPEQGAQLSLQLATEMSGIEKGALYVERNRTAIKSLTPLLWKDEECRAVMKDTKQFLEAFVADNEDGAPLELEVSQVMEA